MDNFINRIKEIKDLIYDKEYVYEEIINIGKYLLKIPDENPNYIEYNVKEKNMRVVYENGIKKTYYCDLLHSFDDKPAISCKNYEEWWYYGKRHREYGPAVIFSDGKKEFWYENSIHNDYGPAIIYPDGRKENWYYNNKII